MRDGRSSRGKGKKTRMAPGGEIGLILMLWVQHSSEQKAGEEKLEGRERSEGRWRAKVHCVRVTVWVCMCVRVTVCVCVCVCVCVWKDTGGIILLNDIHLLL